MSRTAVPRGCKQSGCSEASAVQVQICTAERLLKLLLIFNFGGLELAQIYQESYDKSH